jgi:aminoglycoside 6'-N-acetyltransferase/ribosomal-protein-alanine N-acetyltransferase
VKLRFEPATQEVLCQRGEWHYDAPYDFYDDDGKPVLNPERFLVVRNEEGEFIGFFYFEERGNAVYFGLGLRPDLTGRGFGVEFVQAGRALARERFGSRRIVLDVAEFNVRAAKVYERAGFRVTGRHLRDDVPFVDMELAE